MREQSKSLTRLIVDWLLRLSQTATSWRFPGADLPTLKSNKPVSIYINSSQGHVGNISIIIALV